MRNLLLIILIAMLISAHGCSYNVIIIHAYNKNESQECEPEKHGLIIIRTKENIWPSLEPPSPPLRPNGDANEK